MLESALAGTVDISGQHEHVSLLDPATHTALLDAHAGLEAPRPDGAEPLLLRYRAAHGALAALVREREALAADEGERAQRADYVAFQLGELDRADPKPGEIEALEDERRVLASAEKLREAARAAEALAYGAEGSASERVAQAARALAEAALLDRRLEPMLALLRSAAVELEEAGRELGRYADGVGGDPERLQAVEERLEVLRALARKHGGSLDQALARRSGMRDELARLRGGGERLSVIDEEVGRRGKEAAKLAKEIGRARAEAARGFASAVRRELDGLAMGRCRIEVALLPPESGVPVEGAVLGPSGAERAEILIAPNPGEPPRPLARIASGGELSRILLAVKRTLSRNDPGGDLRVRRGGRGDRWRDRRGHGTCALRGLPRKAGDLRDAPPAGRRLRRPSPPRREARPGRPDPRGGRAPRDGRGPASRGGAHDCRRDRHRLGARARGRPHRRGAGPGGFRQR